MNLRFLENALSRLVFMQYHGTIATDMCHLYYDSNFILKNFKENDKNIIHQYLHIIMHCIFQHAFVNPAIKRPVWNLACDIAVEYAINGLDINNIDTSMESEQQEIFQKLQSHLKYMTAEKIYQYYISEKISDYQCERLSRIFSQDDHKPWYNKPETSSSDNEIPENSSQSAMTYEEA